ncbi:hypothetical protein Thpro_021277 [Acidihalobacter prosperus]|uniref:Uncharacterized protein n=1 Tax=Acidihalobacter prosperus TaxID=160660 RepID=A0A1A6C6P0_9GAMM|nr:hypothetical protein Thpro_021277 [Acidihalobacter prosperus]
MFRPLAHPNAIAATGRQEGAPWTPTTFWMRPLPWTRRAGKARRSRCTNRLWSSACANRADCLPMSALARPTAISATTKTRYIGWTEAPWNSLATTCCRGSRPWRIADAGRHAEATAEPFGLTSEAIAQKTFAPYLWVFDERLGRLPADD